jgi:broad specificity phosphatase PhoE
MPKYQSPYVKIKPHIRSPYTVIYLIRHCNPDYATEKIIGDFNMPLSKIGLEQRKYLTAQLKKIKIDQIYASGMRRAEESAELLAKHLRKKIKTEMRLNEIDWKDWYRIKYFNMSEKTRTKRFKSYVHLNRQLDKMQTIARRLIHDVYRKHHGKTIALFSHGNLIKSIITSILDADIIGFLSLEIYQSAVSKLVIDRDGYVKISYINNISHLPHEPNEDLFISLVE